MLMLPPAVRIFVASQPTDLRRSFDTLAQMARSILRQDPFSGHLFVFFNRTRNRVKILYWERTGFWLCHKRLESGTFRALVNAAGVVELQPTELAMLLDGIELSATRRRKRYARPGPPVVCDT